ncbi:MAG: hypothetical protein DDT20_01061 [Firmicutes bacterium]|nr:hypothetical protein [Bacillota bacterium]
MFEFVPVAEPKAAEQAALMDALVQKIHNLGLEVPAIFFGEALKPVSFAAGQFMHAFGFLPAATLSLSEDKLHQLAFILSDRARLEELLVRLESPRPPATGR